MTFEELKAEANRQGYNLIKKQKYISLTKCPMCGEKPEQWCWKGLLSYKCRCDKHNGWFSTDRAARIAWNDWAERKEE